MNWHGGILGRLKALEQQMASRVIPRNPMVQYQGRPVAYAREVLGVEPWAKQREIAELMFQPPYRVAVRSSHSVGKSFAGGWLINFAFDCYDPCAVICTAPTATHIKDVLFREVRLQRGARGGFKGTSASELYTAPDHYARGSATATSDAFQGRHQERMFFFVDEGIGVDPDIFEAIRSMFVPDGKHHWLIFYNPTDVSSVPYQLEQQREADGSPSWHVVTMASPDHPNVQAGLRGEPAPIPGAVTLGQFEGWLRDWSEEVRPGEETKYDFQWPPKQPCRCCNGRGMVDD